MALLTLAGCGERVERFGGPTMGSSYTVQYVAGAKTPSAQRLQSEVEGILGELDRQFSTYRDDSEISRFNDLPAGACQAMPADLLALLQYGDELSAASDGAFDLTVEPLMNLWGFGPQSRHEQVPGAAELARERERVGYRHVRVDGSQVCKDVAAQLDFDSIVAGYAVDRVSQRLGELGVKDYLVEITGELKAVGRKADGTPWRVALEVPSGERERTVERSLPVDGYGVSTSGDYRNYFEEGGQRYSHTFDARSGTPVRHKLAAVTVVDRSTLHADGLSTLLMVLGPDEGYRFAERHGLAAYFVMHDGQGFATRASPRFAELFPEAPRP
ncbi:MULTISPECIES: FAD:protein FMN transferase [Pseudomonadaceae]|uniref:FAD:protein FMN transferase n=1 Tax=Pseudomonadaceae TaxID=135621 RepID=UPI001A9D807E|nr:MULTISPECIES: FAD:protein FMN transferase [Pseudomonadaceae]MDE5050045.1 FAD:protein FMN transferase [Pseudomonas aeruginosa]QTB77713.1 FAD:protein FMN transferase [Pseudomonas aeruginosa]QTB89853.1 FAD:protein FMN transferase [Pseudomonas aeruginosa]HEJ2885793.1 FAD:protein FMN transferase [Pseudomonas aeruginosa]